MSTTAIITSWGETIAGREQLGTSVFMGAVQFFTACKQQGEIEELRVYVANDGDLATTGGHMIAEGSEAQIAALVARTDYKALIIRAFHVAHQLRTATFVTGEAVLQRIEQVQAVRKELGL